MANKIKVTEDVSSFGNQVFSFELPNGRTLKLEFCPTLADSEGDASVAAASLFEQDGEGIQIAVTDIGGSEKQMMKLPSLWFSTPEEDVRRSQILHAELNAMKEELAPLMEQLEERQDDSQIDPEAN